MVAERRPRGEGVSEPEGRGAAWTEQRSVSEPEGRGVAWTEERGTSDEGRRRSEEGWGGGWGAGRRAGSRARATREGGAVKRDGEMGGAPQASGMAPRERSGAGHARAACS